ncbi:Lactate utilization protein A [Aquisphaera giovannonii]|uniref:Glycolate oxidase iron-sulfur subunit n=1 Tax=Aquisphaera giovannonii TaxID=406548 RepID=A0A5B9W9E2_9BACT|nr:heterodisulfide reductase-related iron-sulfur binding cluster [Aquisphaera giovannonii]QEH36691.1 Lactate utilization protein A [Aquisphaera giovannonii]
MTAPTDVMQDRAGVDLDWLSRRIDYRHFQECVHCGLCTASCPTYLETSNENDSPRGRIYLMRAVLDRRLGMGDAVRRHLDLCLDCRACESACPSGVRYGALIEPFRLAMSRPVAGVPRRGRLERWVVQHLFPHSRRVRAALFPAWVAQKIGLIDLAERTGATGLLPATLRSLVAMLPPLSRPGSRLPQVLPPIGPRRARVALFTGCVADALQPGTNRATARVLRRNGCEVIVPRSQACCGAMHYHSGVEAPAWDLARRNIEAFPSADVDAIVVNAAGCGAFMKDYPHVLPDVDRERAALFAERVADVSEFLDGLGPATPVHPVPLKVAYHDACHLCHAQQVRSQPRRLLESIPGLVLVPLEESELCCGAAGTYNLTQPEMSAQLASRKMDRIEASGADAVAAGNIGCLLQIAREAKRRGSRVKVLHTVDLLDMAYEGDARGADRLNGR